MKYQEAAFFRFGLAAGAASFRRNGFTPGFRVAVSSLLQPLNSYTRYPEYHFMEREIAALAAMAGPETTLRVLDVGSPKLFGFYLARKYPLDLLLTDISPLNIDPYVKMEEAVRRRFRGRVVFAIRDARRLPDADDAFDAVYAMSVLEHIEGEGGDTDAVLNFARVLKPGGRLIFSVPFGPAFREQMIRGVAHAVERTEGGEMHFFQRIYDAAAAEDRLLRPLHGRVDDETARTIERRPSPLLRAYHRLRTALPESAITAMGLFNPLISTALNRDRPGLVAPEAAAYGPIHRFGDIYGDLVFSARKARGK